MIDTEAINDKVDILQLAARDVVLKKVAANEYAGPCPICGGRDRFHVNTKIARWFCRQCQGERWQDAISYVMWRENRSFLEACQELTGGDFKPLTVEQRTIRQQEMENRQATEFEAQQQALAMMDAERGCADVYHRHMQDRTYWHKQGLTNQTIDDYNLGWCPNCPTFRQSASYTIPVYFKDRLLNIRHRLADPPEPNDKYRPHKSGLPATIFNADMLTEAAPFVVLVEGEVKAMVLSQNGFPAVGIPGCTSFKPRWVKWFEKIETVYVCLDPGAGEHGQRIAAFMPKQARIVDIPWKPDDYFVVYGGTVNCFASMLQQAKELNGRDCRSNGHT